MSSYSAEYESYASFAAKSLVKKKYSVNTENDLLGLRRTEEFATRVKRSALTLDFEYGDRLIEPLQRDCWQLLERKLAV